MGSMLAQVNVDSNAHSFYQEYYFGNNLVIVWQCYFKQNLVSSFH